MPMMKVILFELTFKRRPVISIDQDDYISQNIYSRRDCISICIKRSFTHRKRWLGCTQKQKVHRNTKLYTCMRWLGIKINWFVQQHSDYFLISPLHAPTACYRICSAFTVKKNASKIRLKIHQCNVYLFTHIQADPIQVDAVSYLITILICMPN